MQLAVSLSHCIHGIGLAGEVAPSCQAATTLLVLELLPRALVEHVGVSLALLASQQLSSSPSVSDRKTSADALALRPPLASSACSPHSLVPPAPLPSPSPLGALGEVHSSPPCGGGCVASIAIALRCLGVCSFASTCRPLLGPTLSKGVFASSPLLHANIELSTRRSCRAVTTT